MITALLFDLDGTLFDSSEANVTSYSQAFSEAGVTFDADAYKANFGLRFGEMMDLIAPSSTPKQRLQIKDLKTRFYAANIGLVKPNDPLLNFLRSAKDHYRAALVTTASKNNVTNLLDHFLGKEQLFDVIITGEDVKLGKPDPECYTLAIRALGVSADGCLVFEDTKVGVEAARRAGTQVIKVSM